jgi:D-alanyl-D-alanine carboxypeptidase/D-alanyl-D-alanine-endopeptidase (penicillin-binding protein 4)
MRIAWRHGLLVCAIALAGCASAPTARAPHAVVPISAAAPVAPPPRTRSALAARIDALVRQARFATASWGIKVVSLDTGRTLYAHNADKLAVPASNAKLYTASLALDTLGSDYRIATSLYATAGADARGVLAGDLILYGRGDPALGSDDDGHASTAWADRLAATLAARGITRVRGALIADDTYFAGPPIGPGWEARDLQTDFATPASALSVQENTFTLRIDTVQGHCCEAGVDPAGAGVRIVNLTSNPAPGDTSDIGLYRPAGSTQVFVYGSLPAGSAPRSYTLAVPDPAWLAGNLLRDALARRGIAIDGGVRTVHWPQHDAGMDSPTRVHLADVDSPPLGDIVRHALKHSDNLYAQLMLRQVGAKTAASGICADLERPPRSTDGWGLCALRAMLGRIGIADDAALFEEGSGLSRKDLVTPASTVALLGWASRQPFAAVLYDALPIAGVDGTLRNRMRGTVAAGNLRAKTGSLTYTYTLAGYVTDAVGERLAFALMLDSYHRPTDPGGHALGPTPRADLDAIATLLAGYGGRSR